MDNDIKDKGKYQLTNALENMKNKGTKFVPGKVTEWLDCGNKDATVYTNQRVLEFDKGNKRLRAATCQVENSIIIEPCYLGENVKVLNCVVGPHVSLGNGTFVENSVMRNSIVQENTKIYSSNIVNSMIGNYAEVRTKAKDLSVGDYNVIQE